MFKTSKTTETGGLANNATLTQSLAFATEKDFKTIKELDKNNATLTQSPAFATEKFLNGFKTKDKRNATLIQFLAFASGQLRLVQQLLV